MGLKRLDLILAGGFLAFLIGVALASILVGIDPPRSDLRARLLPPVGFGGDWHDPLGTDALGRSMVPLILSAIETSLLVAVLGTLVGAVFGTTLGIAAAALGGLVDDAIMMLVDVQASLPFIILALAVIAFTGPGFGVFLVVVGLFGWERYARIARGLTLAAREEGYARASAHLGAGPVRVYGLHVLPNILGPLAVTLTINFPETLLLETSLSFLGLGIQPPHTSLGALIGEGRAYITSAWWIVLLPGLVISLAAVAVARLGDELTDTLGRCE